MNLKLLSSHFSETLSQLYDSTESEAIFLLVIKHYLNLNRSDLILRKQDEVAENELRQIETVLTELKKGAPIQYIIGETHFFGLTFKVTPAVLIPRPETEELVEWIIETASRISPSKNTTVHSSILDIGTGSGCIAISLKKNLASYQVDALDVAKDSLVIAKENAVFNHVEVNWIHDDILSPKQQTDHQYSIVVSNPPYIKMDEQPAMHHNVLAFEPHRALFVSNEKPLIFYEAIADFAQKHLDKEGWLFFEINEYLGKETIDLLNRKGFVNIELKKDMQGKDRMIRCNKL